MSTISDGRTWNCRHLGEVALPDDGVERVEDGGMVPCGIELGPVRVGEETDEIFGGQLPDELADGLDDAARLRWRRS